MKKKDIQILQDFYMLLMNSTSNQNIVLGGQQGDSSAEKSREASAKRIFEQVNAENSNKLKRIPQFLESQLENLINIFDQFL